MLGAEFKDELFLALNTQDAIRISENVGAEADFQTVFAPLRVSPVRRTRALGFSKFHGAELTGPKDPFRPYVIAGKCEKGRPLKGRCQVPF